MSLRVSARAQAAFGGGSSGSGGLPTSSGTSYGYTKLATPAVGTALGAKGTVGTRAFPFQRLGLQVFYPILLTARVTCMLTPVRASGHQGWWIADPLSRPGRGCSGCSWGSNDWRLWWRSWWAWACCSASKSGPPPRTTRPVRHPLSFFTIVHTTQHPPPSRRRLLCVL